MGLSKYILVIYPKAISMKNSVFLIFIVFFFACSSKKEKIQPTLNDITESVYASVSITPKLSYYAYTSRSGIIKKIFVEQGDTLEQGQPLFLITTSEVDNRLVDANLDLQQAKSNYLGEYNLLQNLQLEMDILQKQLQLDSTNFKRQERLWKQNIGAQIDLDRAKITYQTTWSKHKKAIENYAQTSINLKNNYQKALNRVGTEKTIADEFLVNVVMDGRIYNIFKEEGELISPQQPFAEIGSSNEFKIEMNIDEVDIIRINIGDTVIIALDAYPKQVFKSIVTKIFPKKEEATQTFKVESSFLDTPPKLYNGLSGEANIIIATRKNALTIPSEYLLSENKVLTEEGEKEVKIGVKNMDFVEIIDGIDATTTLLKPNK